MGAGVPVATPRPMKEFTSKSGSTSVAGGTSGSTFARSRDVTASARSLPPLICGTDSVVASKNTSTRPAISSVSGCAPPRNGTWLRSVPASALKSSPERWCTEPTPDEA